MEEEDIGEAREMTNEFRYVDMWMNNNRCPGNCQLIKKFESSIKISSETNAPMAH